MKTFNDLQVNDDVYYFDRDSLQTRRLRIVNIDRTTYFNLVIITYERYLDIYGGGGNSTIPLSALGKKQYGDLFTDINECVNYQLAHLQALKKRTLRQMTNGYHNAYTIMAVKQMEKLFRNAKKMTYGGKEIQRFRNW